MAENRTDRARARPTTLQTRRDEAGTGPAAAPADRTGQYVRGDGPGGRTPAQL